MIVQISNTSTRITGDIQAIVEALVSPEPITPSSIRSLLVNLADCYDADIHIPDEVTISSNLPDYVQYAYIMSVHIGHLILIEGDDIK